MTAREIVNARSTKYIFTLLIVGTLLTILQDLFLSDVHSVKQVISTCIETIGLSVCLPLLVYVLAKLFKGKGNLIDTYKISVFSVLGTFWLTPVFIVLLLLMKNDYFALDSNLVGLNARLGNAGMGILVLYIIWMIPLFISSISEIHKIAKKRVVVIGIICFILMMIYSMFVY